MKYTIVGLGEILWDIFPSGKQLGGAPTNFSYHANALGAEAVVVSSIGSDKLGQEILTNLERLSLNTNYITIDNTKPTGTVSVELDDKGKPSYIIHENVAWDFIPNTSALMALAKKTSAACFGTLAQRTVTSQNTIQAFLKETAPEALRIFDINLRQSFYSKEVIESSLQLANVLKINDEELPIVAKLFGWHEKNEVAVIENLARHYNLRIIALTKGEKGSILYDDTKKEVSVHKGYVAEKLEDTVGAGDAFTAALAIGLLHKKKLDSINDDANRLATYLCSQKGAIPKDKSFPFKK